MQPLNRLYQFEPSVEDIRAYIFEFQIMWRVFVGLHLLFIWFQISETIQIRGNVARKDRFPYTVVITPTEKKGDIFSGALITHQFVLTAASPFVNKNIDEVILSLGVHVLSNKYDRNREDQTVKVRDNVKIHEEYIDAYPLYNNIALVKLVSPVQFTDSIQRIALPTVADEFIDYSGAKVVVTGWGMRYVGRVRTTKAVNFFNTTVYSPSLCNRYYPVWEKNLCTDATLKGLYCVGQYGSPIVTVDDPKLLAVGLEPAGCIGGLAMLQTKVAPYLYWIAMHSSQDPDDDSNESDELVASTLEPMQLNQEQQSLENPTEPYQKSPLNQENNAETISQGQSGDSDGQSNFENGNPDDQQGSTTSIIDQQDSTSPRSQENSS